jgi:hypothetical protein
MSEINISRNLKNQAASMSAVYNRVRKFTLKNDVRLVETILQLNSVFDVNEQNKSGWGAVPRP